MLVYLIVVGVMQAWLVNIENPIVNVENPIVILHSRVKTFVTVSGIQKLRFSDVFMSVNHHDVGE